MTGTQPASPAGIGQWVHADLFGASVAADFRLSLGEGSTPLEKAPQLGAQLGVRELWLKREDLSPTGSHKARSLGLMVSQLWSQGGTQAVISSSGNAAVAAAAYCALAGIRLLSLVSPLTPRVKLEALRAQPGLVVLSQTPVGLLQHALAAWGMTDLRTSTHPLGAAAYRGIAAELEGDWEAVFVPSSSGATALGVVQGFAARGAPFPQLQVVEAEPGGELTRPWYPASAGVAASPSLGTRRSRLAPAVRRAMRETGGRGWRIAAAEAKEVLGLAEAAGVSTSWEGIWALAAARSWALRSQAKGRWAVLLTGAAAQLDVATVPGAAPVVEEPGELDRLLEEASFVRRPG